MLVIFDVDGTLIQGEQLDWKLFADAIEEVTGYRPTPKFWRALEEVTSEAILRRVLKDRSEALIESLTKKTLERFDRSLEIAIQSNPRLFAPRPGIAELLDFLKRSEKFATAFATGEWRSPILKKLVCSGLDVRDLPLATSSDRESRHDIIRLAAQRAGGSLEDAVYVGDGVWDLRAARRLDIPFVGVGSKADDLRAAGAEHVMEPITPTEMIGLLDAIAADRLAGRVS